MKDSLSVGADLYLNIQALQIGVYAFGEIIFLRFCWGFIPCGFRWYEIFRARVFQFTLFDQTLKIFGTHGGRDGTPPTPANIELTQKGQSRVEMSFGGIQDPETDVETIDIEIFAETSAAKHGGRNPESCGQGIWLMGLDHIELGLIGQEDSAEVRAPNQNRSPALCCKAPLCCHGFPA
jgi:hypothetical protein